MSIFGFHLDLNPTFGAYLVGTFISNILLGASCVQTYIYFRQYKDPLIVKVTIITLLILELMHGALSMHVVYHYLISNFLNPVALLTDIWSVNVGFGVTGSIVQVVHLSYANRIYHVSGKKLLIPLLIAMLSSLNFALGWTLMAVLFHNPLVSSVAGTPDKLAKAILLSGAFYDFLIAGTLTFYLNKARTGMKQTDKIIDRLIIYIINNGILTSLFDIVSVVLVFMRPSDLYSLAISQIIGNLYSNSWMATLNSRPRPNDSSDPSVVVSVGLSTFGAASNNGLGGGPSGSTLIRSTGNGSHKEWGYEHHGGSSRDLGRDFES